MLSKSYGRTPWNLSNTVVWVIVQISRKMKLNFPSKFQRSNIYANCNNNSFCWLLVCARHSTCENSFNLNNKTYKWRKKLKNDMKNSVKFLTNRFEVLEKESGNLKKGQWKLYSLISRMK